MDSTFVYERKDAHKEFRNKTLAGLSWSVVSQGGRQFFQIVVGIILARLLTPEAFGLIGMITVFTGFADIFTDLGFSAALIQKRDIKPIHLDTVFWLNVGCGTILTGLFGLLAPFIAEFFNEPLLMPLIIFMSINFFIGSFGIIHRIILQKELAFKKLAIMEISVILISGVIAIIIALYGLGVWSLAMQSVFGVVISILMLWKIKAWRPSFNFSLKALKDLWEFSSNLLGFKTVNYWVRNADNLLIGHFLNSAALGIYSKAYSFMIFPLRNISNTMSKVMFPAFSSIQNDTLRIARVYLRMTRTIAFVSFPMMLGLLIVSDNFVIAVLGEQWSEMIPVLQLLSVVGMIQSIGTLNGNLYLSQGRTKLQFQVGGTVGILGVIAILIGIFWGGSVSNVAMAYTVFSLVVAYPSIHIAVSLVGLTFWNVIKGLLPIFACASVMAVSIYMIEWGLPEGWDEWSQLSIQVLCGVVIYGVLLRLFKLKTYYEVRELIKEYYYQYKSI